MIVQPQVSPQAPLLHRQPRPHDKAHARPAALAPAAPPQDPRPLAPRRAVPQLRPSLRADPLPLSIPQPPPQPSVLSRPEPQPKAHPPPQPQSHQQSGALTPEYVRLAHAALAAHFAGSTPLSPSTTRASPHARKSPTAPQMLATIPPRPHARLERSQHGSRLACATTRPLQSASAPRALMHAPSVHARTPHTPAHATQPHLHAPHSSTLPHHRFALPAVLHTASPPPTSAWDEIKALLTVLLELRHVGESTPLHEPPAGVPSHPSTLPFIKPDPGESTTPPRRPCSHRPPPPTPPYPRPIRCSHTQRQRTSAAQCMCSMRLQYQTPLTTPLRVGAAPAAQAVAVPQPPLRPVATLRCPLRLRLQSSPPRARYCPCSAACSRASYRTPATAARR